MRGREVSKCGLCSRIANTNGIKLSHQTVGFACMHLRSILFSPHTYRAASC